MEINENDLVSWINHRLNDWRNHYEQNYLFKDEEYDRIYRGIWKDSDKTRDTERSKIVSPATSQAVESSVAEVEEAIFGRGSFFDITDDLGDEEREDVAYLRNKLSEEFKARRFRRAISEVLLNSAVTGIGIAETVLDEEEIRTPARREADGMVEVGVNKVVRTACRVIPVHPKHFLIEPAATTIEDALGCAIDKPVPLHEIELLQEKGIYNDDEEVGSMATELNLELDQSVHVQPQQQARLTKYYGLVPTELLKAEGVDVPDDASYTEAMVVLGNKRVLLKAEVNPFMMKARPVFAFAWDLIPGRFRGRGVCEKGYNSQKAIESELRARIDALALTTHPMLAMDGTAMPRGIQPKVVPGKTIITNGNPKDVLMPFNFGQVNQITFPQTESLQRMLQQATGAVDTNGVSGAIPGQEGTAAGISMSLGAIIKRHKRTLVSFQEDFLIPLIKQVAFMYMQFNPDEYPAGDYRFNVTGSLGIMAREYEVTQLVQLLQTTGQDSPIYIPLVNAIVDNMNLSNRENLIKILKEASQPTPEQQQAQEEARQIENEIKRSQSAALMGQANESNARAKKYDIDGRAVPLELQNKRISAIAQLDEDDEDFSKRSEIAKIFQKDEEIGIRKEELGIKKAETIGRMNASNQRPNGRIN